MTALVFYEKPGCAGNARQKRLLRAAGVELEVRDLLAEPWTAPRLRAFFGDLPVAQWFNRSAPRVKSGDVDPDRIGAEGALALMLAEPLLIRRPLLEWRDWRAVGFDMAAIGRALALREVPAAPADIESCRSAAHHCATPEVQA